MILSWDLFFFASLGLFFLSDFGPSSLVCFETYHRKKGQGVSTILWRKKERKADLESQRFDREDENQKAFSLPPGRYEDRALLLCVWRSI